MSKARALSALIVSRLPILSYSDGNYGDDDGGGIPNICQFPTSVM